MNLLFRLLRDKKGSQLIEEGLLICTAILILASILSIAGTIMNTASEAFAKIVSDIQDFATKYLF